MKKYDRFTGKPVPEINQYDGAVLDEVCDECGTKLITGCVICGAPVCCQKCCIEEYGRRHDEGLYITKE